MRNQTIKVNFIIQKGKLNKDGKLLPINSNSCSNLYLKELADLCGIKKEITYHLARHSKHCFLLRTSRLQN